MSGNLTRLGMNLLVALTIASGATPADAQSLDDRLDVEQYLRELEALDLPEVIDRFLLMDADGDPVAAAERRIELLRERVPSTPTEGGAREETIRRVLDLRAALIEAHPDHRHRATWLTEQALDAWIELASIDTSELAAMVGVPTGAQRERAAGAAEIGFNAARRAEAAIRETLLEIESAPGFADNLQLQLERRRLAEQERDRRIPFLLGVLATLHAELNLDATDARRRTFRLAADALPPVLERVRGLLADRARLYLGWSLMRLGALDEAREHFHALKRSPDADRNARMYAHFAEVRRLSIERGPGAALEELVRVERECADAPQPLLGLVLVADNRFRLRREQALARTGEERDEAMTRAFASYLSLLDAEVGLPRDALRSVVFTRLLAAVDEQTPLDDLPPVVSIARAAQLVEDGRAAAVDEAVELLGRVLDIRELDPREEVLALLTRGRACQAAGQIIEAATSYFRLARDYPQERESEQAITLALALAAEALPREPATARPLVQEGLDLLFERYPNLPAIDVWRLWAARLALADGRTDEALAHAERITPDAETWLDARLLRAEALRRRVETAPDSAEAARDASALQQVIVEARAGVRRARDARELTDEEFRAMSDELALHEAFAYHAIGETQRALEIIESMEARAGGAEARPQAHLLRFRVLEAAGRLAEAHAALDAYLEQAPERAGETLMPMLSELRDRVAGLRRQGRVEDADRVAERELFPVAERFEAWLEREDDVAGSLPQHYLLAESYRLAGACTRALDVFDRLLAAHPQAEQFLLGRAECQFLLGGDSLADAMRTYRRLAGAQRDESETFWLSQLRMLQILDRTGRNTHQILPQIQRLRERDRDLGGERFRREFERLQNKYAAQLP